ncbi:MAG: hypothetical protein FWC34_10475 [Bacteroidetes bacterium]|nr:hypothetical protein [Bacteroidota bacterium]MCL2302569.1 hypothetical protein [Lentimicrobiaceae bacterium]
MTENRIFIHQKIKDFVRKYYLNKLYKGALIFVMITTGVFIAFTLLEYFSYLNSTTRAVLFYTYLALFVATIAIYVIYPLLKIAGLGKTLNSLTVSKIIGKHFPEIDDKLLNIIQLESQIENGKYKSIDLLNAAIDTKIETLKPFAFVKAIPFKKSTRFVKWAMIPVLLLFVLFSTKSEIFTESTQRIVQYQQHFEKPAPYKIEITNKSLKALQNDDFTVYIKIVGDETPNELFIVYDKRNYRCVKQSNTEFTYTFSNLQRDMTFQLQTEEVTTSFYTINVLPKPVIVSYVMELSYPSYLNKNKEIIENNGDATVPEGTRITWKFYTKNTNQIDFLLQDKEEKLIPEKEVFTFSHTARESFHYATISKNQYFVSPDTLSYNIQVIKDLYPEIGVQSQADSLFADRVYFKGNIRDDYGFTSLRFVYSIFDDSKNLLEQDKTIDIHFDKNATIQDFYFNFDAGSLNLRPGYAMEYFFEVKDNDGVNGPKTAKTQAVTFRLKTMDEINEEIAQSNEQTKNAMEDLAKEAADLAKEMEKLSHQLLTAKEPSWQDKKKMEALMEQYKELQNKIQESKNEQDRNLMKEEQYKNTAAEILKKQEELQKRFDNLLSDEIKDLIEKMQNMMQEMNKDQMRDALEKMKMSAEDINKSLDQQLSLFKLLEFEKKFQEVIDNMRNLAQEQRDLSQQTDQRATPKEDLQQKQEQLNQKFQDLQKEIQDLHKLNKELEEPNKLQNRSEQEQQIMQKMKEAAEQLNKNNRSRAKDSQSDAAQQMEDMADSLQQEKDEAEEEDLAEDIETLRQILDNLIRVSFKQEDVMQGVRKVGAKSPLLTDYIREQSNIQDYMRMIGDSLTQLAKRQPMVEPFITKEVTKIREYSKASIEQLVDRKIPPALSNQQFALTSMNNLALMLAESLKKMKDTQMQGNSSCCKSKKSKCGDCSKPGKGKGKAKSARELQQQLNRQMEAMKRSMEQGSKPDGQAPAPGQQGMSEQFARMAAQQEAIRKMMQDYNDELRGQYGTGDKSIEELLEEMKKTERELVNRSISTQTISRQKNIEMRMLESERAQQEREREEKRESTEARERYNPSPPKEWQFDKNRSQQTELLKTVPPSLQYYYKEKVNRYFYNIGD